MANEIEAARKEGQRLAELNKPLPRPTTTEPYQQRDALEAAWRDARNKKQ